MEKIKDIYVVAGVTDHINMIATRPTYRTLPRNPILWSPEEVAHFLETHGHYRAALNVRNTVELSSFVECDGPRLLSLDDRALEELGIPQQLQTAVAQRLVEAQATPHPPVPVPLGAAATTTTASSPSVRSRVAGALWGLFIADAMGMPTHWYYDPDALKDDFGRINGFVAPKERHPTNDIAVKHWMSNKHGIQDLVRGGQFAGGKPEIWAEKNSHYHAGMQAGENTLGSLLVRLVLRSLASTSGKYSRSDFLRRYVRFMTTPGSHNDTYVEGVHRQFFLNYFHHLRLAHAENNAQSAERFGPMSTGRNNHDTAGSNGLLMLVPIVFTALRGGEGVAGAADSPVAATGRHERTTFDNSGNDGKVKMKVTVQSGRSKDSSSSSSSSSAAGRAMDTAEAHLSLTHDCPRMQASARIYNRALLRMLSVDSDAAALEALVEAGHDYGIDLSTVQKVMFHEEEKVIEEGFARNRRRAVEETDRVATYDMFGPSCYIASSMPLFLHFAHKYLTRDGRADAFRHAVLANTNAGGETCNRGAALGALLGAAVGVEGIPAEWRRGLVHSAEIEAEIEAFADALGLPGAVAATEAGEGGGAGAADGSRGREL